MKFTRLEVNRFRNIDSFSSEIGDGIVILKGPNEAGKSSLLSTILFALFEDPKSSAERLEQAREWNKETLYQLTLAFKTNGETYVLEKDFENKSTLLRNETTNESWKDKNRINAKLAETLGFFSKNVFTSTACVFQDELDVIGSGQKELRTLLEEKVVGKEDSAVEPVLKRLEKKVLDLKRGLDRPAPTNPGHIRRVVDELSDVKQRRDEIADLVSRLHNARQRVHHLSKDLDETKKSLEIKKQAFEKSNLYVKAKEKHEDLSRTLEKTLRDLEKLTKADREMEGLTVQHEAKQKNLKDSKTKLEKCRTAAKIMAEKEALELELKSKKEILNKAGKIAGAVDELKKSLGGLPVVSEKSVRELLQTESDINALEKSLGQRAMLLKVTFKTRTPYLIETEDGVLSRGKGTAGETFKGEAKKEIRINFKDVAEVQVATRDQTLDESMKELKKKKGFLENQLKQHQCQSVAELADMKNRREKNERELEARENELTIILGKETVESVGEEVVEFEKRLDQLSKAFEEAKDLAVSEEELNEQERETHKLSSEVQDLEGNIREKQGILKSFSKEELEKEKKDLARKMLVTETALDDLKAFESSGEKIVKQESEITALERKLSDLKVERQALEHILQEDRYGQEDVAELEERIESLEWKAETFRMRLRAYEVISEVLEEARQNILGSISGQVDERIGAYFALITDSKYDQVRLSREDFSLHVFSREKGDWINPDSEELSAGAKDQLYLAARLALVDTVSSGNAIPLILDDPLVHFDSSRRENTQKLLKEISKTHQVLLFSCHDYYNKWADQVIEF